MWGSVKVRNEIGCYLENKVLKKKMNMRRDNLERIKLNNSRDAINKLTVSFVFGLEIINAYTCIFLDENCLSESIFLPIATPF